MFSVLALLGVLTSQETVEERVVFSACFDFCFCFYFYFCFYYSLLKHEYEVFVPQNPFTYCLEFIQGS